MKAAMEALAEAMAADSPHRYASTITKSKRARKILLNDLRKG